MRNLKQSKSILARLMATENIHVDHVAAATTASFNLENRTLTCPVWENMEGDLYDLLMGHEVGHALETPAQGWHDAIFSDGTDGKKLNNKFKSFLNVVEDARIERKMKRRYPGLRRSFYVGYGELMNRDFFGVKERPEVIDLLNIIDRINLHFKVGPFLGVKFTEQEQKWVDRVEKLETWDEVVAISKELYDYSQESEQDKIQDMDELKKLLEMLKDSLDSFGEGEEFDDFDGNGNGGHGSDFPDGKSYEDLLNDESTPEEIKELLRELLEKMKNSVKKSSSEPSSITDQIFRQKEASLIDDPKNAPINIEIPEADLKKIIFPFKKTYSHFKKQISINIEQQFPVRLWNHSFDDLSRICLNAFEKRNNKYISLLIKNFEMHKNADQYSRQRVSKSGELDTNKLHKYKITSDVFRRITTVDKGKNHGMILFLDMSSSMYTQWFQSVEQILVLASFCKKTNIPFVVYGFCDGSDSNVNNYFLDRKNEKQFIANSSRSFDFVQHSLTYGKFFHLKELVSSSLTPNDYRRAISMLMIAGTFMSPYYNRSLIDDEGKYNALRLGGDVCGFNLSSTPLNQTLIASLKVIEEFKIKHKVDILNVVHVTDGEGNGSDIVIPQNIPQKEQYNLVRQDRRYIFTDPKTKISVQFNGFNNSQSALTNLVKKISGVQHIGFFLASGTSSVSHRLTGNSVVDPNWKVLFKKDGFVEVNGILGYDSYYFINNTFGERGEKEFCLDEEESNRAAAKKFIKNQNKKHASRAILARFAKQIAT